jgi:hypothetical protein
MREVAYTSRYGQGMGRTGPDPNDRVTCGTFLSDGYSYRFVYASRCKKADLKLPCEATVPAR